MINEVVEQVINGDKEQYRQIVNEFYTQIYSFIVKQVFNSEEAKDIAQEVFIKIYLNLKKFDASKSSFKTWIYVIASNHCLDYFKSKHYKQQFDLIRGDFDITDDINLLNQMIDKEDLSVLKKIMNNKLKKKHQQILQLHYFADLDVKEIATLLKMSNKTVYSAIHSSIRIIKNEMEVYVNEQGY